MRYPYTELRMYSFSKDFRRADVIGTPGRSRTCNLFLRTELLYPIELQGHNLDYLMYQKKSVEFACKFKNQLAG